MNKEYIDFIHDRVEEYKNQTPLSKKDFTMFLIFKDYLDILGKDIQAKMLNGAEREYFENNLLVVNNCKMFVNAILYEGQSE